VCGEEERRGRDRGGQMYSHLPGRYSRNVQSVSTGHVAPEVGEQQMK
jgi:hypothetical protein